MQISKTEFKRTDLKKIKIAYALQEMSGLPWKSRLRLFQNMDTHYDWIERQVLSPLDEGLDRSLLLALDRGVQFVCIGDDFYPSSLLEIENPPLVLSVMGSPLVLSKMHLAVVGSRNPSLQSMEWLSAHLGEFVRKKVGSIVSGGAYGIDRKAHSVCVLNGGETLNFLPSGILNPYPSIWRQEKLDFIRAGGVFVSEFLPQQQVDRKNFSRRNRLICGISQATLIVDAGARSGTLLTARLAIEQSRPIFILPGHPADPRVAGSIELMMEGAPFVRDSLDLIEYFKAECTRGRGGMISSAPCH